jgi:hypothetical protein
MSLIADFITSSSGPLFRTVVSALILIHGVYLLTTLR